MNMKFTLRSLVGVSALALSSSGWLFAAPPAANQPKAVPLAASPTIGVLVEPGLPIRGGIPSLPPRTIPGLLEKHGLKSRVISVPELLAGQGLNPAEVPVLILPHGDIYPVPAIAAIKTYHAAGGCLVLAGWPFTRPANRTGDAWIEEEKPTTADRRYKEVIGTASFYNPPKGHVQMAHPGFLPNPLALDDTETPAPPRKRSPLSVKGTPNDTSLEIIPIVEMIEEADPGKSHVVSALIRHNSDAFKGARDVWIGEVAANVEQADAWFGTQLLVRGAAWCLREKGWITPETMTAIFRHVGQEGRQSGLPSDLAYQPKPRPWGDTFLPKSNPPARRLTVVDLGRCSSDERRALYCLQGLTSRKQPSIWFAGGRGDLFWLNWHVSKNHIDGYEFVQDIGALFREHAAAYRGAVIADPDLYRGDILAANVAACEDLIVATPELAAKLGIPVRLDLRKKFATYADGLDWLWRTYGGVLNHDLCDFSNSLKQLSSYAIQWRAPILWPSGPVDGQKPGASILQDKLSVARVLAAMNPNTAVLGYPYGGTGVGPGEGEGVGFLSNYAHSLVCTDFLANICVTSGVVLPRLKQKTQKPPPTLEKDKIYIALALSDGDNQNTWPGFFRKYFEHPRHGDFPLAYGMGPPILDLQPALAQWYYEHATPGTEFFADVSGVGYMQPENYALKFREPQRVYEGYLDWTSKYQARLDMHTLRTGSGEDDLLIGFSKKVAGMHSLFADMGRYGSHQGIANLTYSLPDGLPVFRAVTSWRYGKEGFLREVREQVGNVRPAFVNGFVHCWTFDMDALARIYDQRDPDMVFVTPAQLAQLYKQHQAGAAKP